MRPLCLFTALLLASAGPSRSGTFIKSNQCPNRPFIIVHPAGYDGTGGLITLRICSSPGSPDFFVDALEEATGMWNRFQTSSPNCDGCRTIEEANAPGEPLSLASVLFHELGHCAFALGHPNQPGTSFTISRRDCPAPPDKPPVVVFNPGDDGIPGSNDDIVFPLPGTRILHWFRNIDNNPVLVDATLIDQDTFTRRRLDLPPGHTWPANANRLVADSLGLPGNHSIMYSRQAPGATYRALSADDAATVQFAQTGLDSDFGTADDYAVQLALETDCSNAEIEVRYRSFGDDPDLLDRLAICTADIEPAAPPPPGEMPQHHTLAPPLGVFERIMIEVDSRRPWDDIVFADNFETSDTSQWADELP